MGAPFVDSLPFDSGRAAREIRSPGPGSHLYTRLPRGVDKAFARFYVKFAADADYLDHFVTLGGYNPPTAWPQGGAGERPRRDDRFTAGIEPYLRKMNPRAIPQLGSRVESPPRALDSSPPEPA